MPENIKPCFLLSSLYLPSITVVDTLGPLSIVTALKSSRILSDSTPISSPKT